MAKRMTVQDYMNQGYNKAQAERHVKWDNERERENVAAEIGIKMRKARRATRQGTGTTK